MNANLPVDVLVFWGKVLVGDETERVFLNHEKELFEKNPEYQRIPPTFVPGVCFSILPGTVSMKAGKKVFDVAPYADVIRKQ